jgi:transglutaminase-like putative cysteine protease
VKHLAEEDSPIRAVYLEQVAKQDQPTVFEVQYEYTVYGVRFLLDPEEVTQIDAHDSALETFTGEGPHVVFTDKIRALSARLVGPATNPLIIARRLYDWVTDSIRYSYAQEYSTIRNISDHCLVHGNGDCGEETLLFITLCRYNGIPARWQSGWLTFPGELNIHDWAEIYLAPYGWIPVDPYMGIRATQYLKGMSEERREFVRDFYFGGLDQYRMAANSDHCQQLTPAKRSMRSDNVDFQRGELEHRSTNIYFDRFSYDLTPQEIGLSE